MSNCEVAQGLLDIVSWGDGIMGYREGSSLLRIVSVTWMVICVLCIIMLMWLSSLGQSVEQYRADFGSDTVDYVRFMQKNAGILYLDYLFQIFVGVVGYRAGQRTVRTPSRLSSVRYSWPYASCHCSLILPSLPSSSPFLPHFTSMASTRRGKITDTGLAAGSASSSRPRTDGHGDPQRHMASQRRMAW